MLIPTEATTQADRLSTKLHTRNSRQRLHEWVNVTEVHTPWNVHVNYCQLFFIKTLTPTTFDPWWIFNSSTPTAWDVQLNTGWLRSSQIVFSHSQSLVLPKKKDTMSSSVCIHNLTLNCHCFVWHLKKFFITWKAIIS